MHEESSSLQFRDGDVTLPLWARSRRPRVSTLRGASLPRSLSPTFGCVDDGRDSDVEANG